MPVITANSLTGFSVIRREHCTKIVESLVQSYIHEDNLDLIFICDKNIVVKAHKLVIASVSRFLKKMILAEKNVAYISLPGIDARKLRLLIYFLYEGNSKINEDELITLKEVMTLLEIRLSDTEIRPFCNSANDLADSIPRNQNDNVMDHDNVYRNGAKHFTDRLPKAERANSSNSCVEMNPDMTELQNELQDPLNVLCPLVVPGSLYNFQNDNIVQYVSAHSLIEVKEEMVNYNEFIQSTMSNDFVNDISNENEISEHLPNSWDNTDNTATEQYLVNADANKEMTVLDDIQTEDGVILADNVQNDSEYEEFPGSTDNRLQNILSYSPCETTQNESIQESIIENDNLSDKKDKPTTVLTVVEDSCNKITTDEDVSAVSGETINKQQVTNKSGICKIFPKISCKTCKKKFLTERSLGAHNCWKYRQHKCVFCDASFDLQSKCDAHIRLHEDVRPYKCDKCQRLFNQKFHLDNHKVCRKASVRNTSTRHVVNMNSKPGSSSVQYEAVTCNFDIDNTSQPVDTVGDDSITGETSVQNDATNRMIVDDFSSVQNDTVAGDFKVPGEDKDTSHNLDIDMQSSTVDNDFKGNLTTVQHNIFDEKIEVDNTSAFSATVTEDFKTSGMCISSLQATCGQNIKNKDLENINNVCKLVAKISCKVCKKKFLSKRSLKVHNCGTYKLYKCDFCDASFDYENKCDAHIRVHLGVRPYKCHKCSRSFIQKHHLCGHKRHCKASVRNTLTRHVVNMNSKPGSSSVQYEAVTCNFDIDNTSQPVDTVGDDSITGETSVQNDAMNRMIVDDFSSVQNDTVAGDFKVPGEEEDTSHNFDIDMQSSTVDTDFKGNLTTVQHNTFDEKIEVDNTSAFSATVTEDFKTLGMCISSLQATCGQKFKNIDLKNVNNVCKLVAKISCEVCKKKFLSKSSLKVHNCGTYKLHKCDFCDASFDYENKCDAHIRVHLGVKPYKCHKCSRSFIQKQVLRGHKRHCKGNAKHSVLTTGAVNKNSKAGSSSIPDKAISSNLDSHATSETTGAVYQKVQHDVNSTSNDTINEDIKVRDMFLQYVHGKMISDRNKSSICKSSICKIVPNICCKTCGKRFISDRNLNSHDCLEYKRFKCNYCDASFDARRHCAGHMSIHMSVKRYKCGVCNRSFNYLRSLDKHKNHCKENLKSAVSIKGAVNKNSNLASSSIPNETTVCNLDIATSVPVDSVGEDFEADATSALNQTVAEGIKLPVISFPSLKSVAEETVNKELLNGSDICKITANISCGTCGKKFISKKSMSSHNCWEYKRYKCSYCDSSFNERTHCDEHMRIHMGLKRYGCLTCNQSYSQKHSLDIHKKCCKGIPLQPLQCASRKSSGPRKIIANIYCKTCGKRFVSARSLRAHTCFVYKPYRCDHCDASFNRRDKCNIHIRTLHMIGKLYKCNVCSQYFDKKCNLDAHKKCCKGVVLSLKNHRHAVTSHIQKMNKTAARTFEK